MNELSHQHEEPTLSTTTLHIEATATMDPEAALNLQQRVLAVFSGIDGLSYTVTFGTGETTSDAGTSPEVTEVSAETLQREQWLNTGISVNREQEMSGRTYNRLYFEGIRTYRDIFTIGEREISEIRNFGSKSMAEVKAVVENNPFGITFEATPTLQTLATFCNTLDQVPARVALGSHYKYQDASLGQIVNAPIEYIIEHYVSKRRLETRDPVTGDVVEKPYTEAERYEYLLSANKIKATANDCAQAFTAAKQKQQ